MPLMSFDRILKIISTVLNILSVALSAIAGVDFKVDSDSDSDPSAF